MRKRAKNQPQVDADRPVHAQGLKMTRSKETGIWIVDLPPDSPRVTSELIKQLELEEDNRVIALINAQSTVS